MILSDLDTAIRLISIGASLLLLVLLVAGEVRRDLKIALLGLLLGAMAYVVNSSGAFRTLAPSLAFIDLASLMIPFWIWLFARYLFEKPPSRWLVAVLLIVNIACWYMGNFLPQTRPIGFYTIHIVGLGLVVDLIRAAWAGRNDDLVEKRRLIRLWFPILVALQAGGILAYETVTGGAIADPPIQLTNALLILALTLFSGLALLRPDPELLLQTESDAKPQATGVNEFSASESLLHDKLTSAMEQGYYRTPGLTIAGLAEHLGTPEHRLRALINRRLGHRNFSAFLNRHRIAEARAILADREQVDLPVLTIAMDLGYNSLPTFNRAFRTETSMTPSDYRREKVSGGADQN